MTPAQKAALKKAQQVSAQKRRGKRQGDAFDRAAQLANEVAARRAPRAKQTFKAIYQRMRHAGHSKLQSTHAAFYHSTRAAGADSRMGRAFAKYMNRKRSKRA